MSDKVIRLGGSHIGKKDSIQHLKQYISQYEGRNFIVVSAVPELLDLFTKELSTVFAANVEEDGFTQQLLGFFNRFNQGEVTGSYKLLAIQAASLLKGITLIGDYSRGLKDQVISFAERLSVELFKVHWTEAVVLTPEEIELRTTPDYGNASYISVNVEKLANLTKGTYLIPGTFGLTADNKIARTGRTAADYTAAFLTRELGVEKLELWDLDKKFYRADPAILEEKSGIRRLTYSEASELAYFDHFSFHPRTVEPLENQHIPIVVLNSASADGVVETTINTETFVEGQIVKSVACTDDISLLKLDGPGVGLKPGILAKVTNQLNESGLNIKSVITSQTSINFILNHENGAKALALIHNLGFSSVTEISVVEDVSLIGIVGHGMQHAYGVSAKIFTAVANNKINVVLSGSGASDLVSYLVVHQSDKVKSVREIYKAFFQKVKVKEEHDSSDKLVFNSKK